MLELASLGSKVLQIRSVEFAGKYKVKLRVLSSFEKNGDGTIITYEEDHKMEDPIISGIAFNRDEAKVTVQGIPDTPGLAYQILGPIAEQNIDVDMIIQNIGHDGENDFTFTVNKNELDKTIEILEGMKSHIKAKEIIGDPNIAKLSLVGVGMKSHVGVASKMFRTLSEEGINISTISTSEIKISILIDENLLDMAVQSLHKAFNLDQ
jgi:aspartate kinase